MLPIPPPPGRPAPPPPPTTPVSSSTALPQSYPPPPPPPPAANIPPAPVPAEDPEALKGLFQQWQPLVEQLKIVKEKEMALRKQIVALAFASQLKPNGCLPEGTNKKIVETPSFVLSAKCVQKMKREVLEELVLSTLTEIVTAFESEEEASAACGGLLKTKHELSMTAYKKLPEAAQKVADKMIVVKPASIELEITYAPK